MSSERIQRRIERLLDLKKAAAERSDWEESRQSAELILAMDPDNAIAQSYVLRAGQGTIEHLLDQVEEAADRRDWDQVRLFAGDILALDPDNVDAQTYNAAADRVLDNISDEPQRGHYEIVVDSSTGVATVRGDKVDFLPIDERTHYQRAEFAVLEALYRSRGRALSLQQIMDECSSVFFFDSPARVNDIIHKCIISLRMRIEEDPSNPKIIRDVGDRSATSSGWPDRYIIAPSFVQTLDTGDISLPKLPEETNQELDQVTAVEPTGQEQQDERQTRPAEDSRRSRWVGAFYTEDYRKPPKRTEGFHWHGGMLKRILLIAVVGLIFGVVGQFIAIFTGVAFTPASTVLTLIGYIIGGIIGNKLYDQGVG